jgi:predicted ATPase
MLVYGYSGAGKTSLVKQALQDLVESDSSFLCTGKFEQHRSSQAPWHGIIDAYEDLCHQILTCANRRTEIRELLMTEYDGSEVKLLTDFIPSLRHLMKEDKGGETNGEEGVGSVKAATAHDIHELQDNTFWSA